MARVKISCDEFEAKPYGNGVSGIMLDLSMDDGDLRDAIEDLAPHSDVEFVVNCLGLEEVLDAIGKDAACRHFGIDGEVDRG